MTTHILAITYQPKIEGVKNGIIRQTIRLFNPKNPRKVGDKVILHGWKGKPYRSPWSWRREEKVTVVLDMVAMETVAGFWQSIISGKALSYESVAMAYYPWFGEPMEYLAKLDGIPDSSNNSYTRGELLKQVLENYHGKFTDKPVQMQVIRW